eukprot:303683_1
MFTFLLLFVNVNVNGGATEYPLFAAMHDGTNPPLTDEDIQTIANNFDALNRYSHNQTAIELLHSYNPNLKLLSYVNSHVASPNDAAESNKNSIAKYPFAVLTKPLSNKLNDQTVNIELINQFKQTKNITILASNINGNYSQNCSNYVSFIQINNEYMKVLSIVNISDIQYSLNVIRGFVGNPSNNSISQHSINSTLFAPIYVKSAPGAPDCNRLRYAMNIESEFAVSFLVNSTMNALNKGYNGSWYDCFSQQILGAQTMNTMHLNVSDVWSDNLQTFYSCTSFRQQQQIRLTKIWNQVNDNAIIYANNMNQKGYFDNTCGLRELLIANPPNFAKPLSGYSIEGYPQNIGLCGDSPYNGVSTQGWIANVNELIDAGFSGLNARPRIAGGGCNGGGLETANDTYYNQIVLFAYTSVLLAVNQRNTTIEFGIPPMRYMNNGKGPKKAWISPIFRYNIGGPIQHFKNVTQYKIGNGHCSYWRLFENGIILINPELNQTDYNINLNKSYFNPMNNKTVKNNITLNSFS